MYDVLSSPLARGKLIVDALACTVSFSPRLGEKKKLHSSQVSTIFFAKLKLGNIPEDTAIVSWSWIGQELPQPHLCSTSSVGCANENAEVLRCESTTSDEIRT